MARISVKSSVLYVLLLSLVFKLIMTVSVKDKMPLYAMHRGALMVKMVACLFVCLVLHRTHLFHCCVY